MSIGSSSEGIQNGGEFFLIIFFTNKLTIQHLQTYNTFTNHITPTDHTSTLH